MKKKAQIACVGIAAVVSIAGGVLPIGAQTSSPTKMTVAIMRGNPWNRLRTCAPSIFGAPVTAGARGAAGVAFPGAGRAGAPGAGPGEGGGRGPFGGTASWNMTASLEGFGQVTFFGAIDKEELLFVNTVEGYSTQKVSAEIPKNLDANLTAEEVNAVKRKLRAANQRMVAYRVPTIGSNEAEIRKLFQFAKELNVDTIVSDPPPEALPAIDKVATEFNIRVALLNRGKDETPAYADPQSLLNAVEGLRLPYRRRLPPNPRRPESFLSSISRLAIQAMVPSRPPTWPSNYGARRRALTRPCSATIWIT